MGGRGTEVDADLHRLQARMEELLLPLDSTSSHDRRRHTQTLVSTPIRLKVSANGSYRVRQAPHHHLAQISKLESVHEYSTGSSC